MSARSGGRFLCDAFHVVPRGVERRVRAGRGRARRARGRRLSCFPQSSGEVVQFAANRAALRDAAAGRLARGDRRAATTRRRRWRWPSARASRRRETHLARTPEEFRAAAAELGYPERDVCMKPPQAKGSRGFRVLSANVDRRYALLEARPGPLPLSVDEALEAIGDEDFPPLLVMELATGQGAHGRRHLPRRPARARPREDARGDARRPRDVLRDRRRSPSSRRPRGASCAELRLDWFVNVQFIGEHLLEINPRISTIVYQDDLNLPVPGRPARARRARRGAARRLLRRRAHHAARAALLRPGRVRRAVSGGGAPRRAPADARPAQSLIYGLGPVVARFAGLLLLPIYTRHLEPRARSRNVGRRSWRSWPSGATIAQLGLVNALFRFAAEREGEAPLRGRRAPRSRICAVSGLVARDDRGARDAGRRAALARRRQRGALARGLRGPADLAALRADAPASTASSSGRSASSRHARQRRRHGRAHQRRRGSHFDGGAFGLVAGLLHRHARRARWSSLWDRRTVLFGSIDRALAAARCCASACRSCPRALALWALNLSNRLLVAWLATRRARRRVRRRREHRAVGRAAGDGVPARLAAVRVRDQGRRRGAPRLPLRAHALAARRARGRAAARARCATGCSRCWPASSSCGARRRDGADGARPRRSTAPTTSSAWPSAASSGRGSTGS